MSPIITQEQLNFRAIDSHNILENINTFLYFALHSGRNVAGFWGEERTSPENFCTSPEKSWTSPWESFNDRSKWKFDIFWLFRVYTL
jgi:hypothetical protein